MGEHNRKKVYVGLDMAKFGCAYLILFYHYFSEHGPLPNILEEALSLYAVAVALFMVISGFLMFDRLASVESVCGRWKLVRKYVQRILTIYLLWSIPYLLYTVSSWNWGGINAQFLLKRMQNWIFGSTFYTIWFMPMLAAGMVLAFWLTEKVPAGYVTGFAVLMYAAGSLMSTYQFVGARLPGFEIASAFAGTWLGGPRGWLFYAFPLIMLGRAMVTVKNKIKWSVMAVLSLMFMALLVGEALALRYITGAHTGIDMAIMMVPAVFCILGFLVSVPLPNWRYCVQVRQMSVLVFMTQRLFLTVLPSCFPSLFAAVFHNNMAGGIIICCMVTGFSALILTLSHKIRWMSLLY